MSAKPGEVICVTGSNFDLQERDRFVKVLLAEASPNYGKVLINGTDVQKIGGRRSSGRVEQIRIMPLLSASENLLFYMGL